MNEENKELLINFVKCNKFYKEKNGNLSITIDFELKDEINKAIKKLLNIFEQKDRMIDLMIEHIYTGCDFDNNIKTKEQIRKYFERMCK